MDDEALKQRNISIAAHVAGFLLPLVGIVAAFLFYSRGERDRATTVLGASLAGVVVYVLLFTV
jgi:hypothetical protein